MPTSALILVLARATLLFVAGFALLWLSKRSAPALRHVVCLSAIAGSLLVLPTLFLPDSAIVIHVPLAGGLAIAASAGPEGLTWAEYAAIVWACGCAVVMLRLPIGYTVLSRVRRRAVHAGEAAPGVGIRGRCERPDAHRPVPARDSDAANCRGLAPFAARRRHSP